MKHTLALLLSAFIINISDGQDLNLRSKIDLQGKWQFALDTGNTGSREKWFLKDFSESVSLPGTTDLNHKGFLNRDSTTMHLSRVYRYEGAAWYRKKVTIPRDFQKKHIELFLERSKLTTVWIDGNLVGGSKLLQTPQQFDVSNYLKPGEHFITVRVDNRLQLTPYGNVHIYSDDTQTNWNGIIGKIHLEASPKTYIKNLQVYPNIDARKIDIKLALENQLKLKNASIELFLERTINGKTEKLKSQKVSTSVDSVLSLTYNMGNDCSLWDEFQQPVYTLTAVISSGNTKDSRSATFGMRSFTAKGTQFNINGRTTFLRGKHEACVFPLTGHPPMEKEGWLRVFQIAKSYGINHYRFHSYCPPEAAFAAADEAGIYIQAELPFWGGLNTDSVANMLRDEGLSMLKNYANHPSFVMFSHGNEIWGGHARVEKNIEALKEYDNRLLYTLGSNVNIGYYWPKKSSDFFVGARTPSKGDTTLTHTRLTHAFADSRDGATLNSRKPSTDIRFPFPVSQFNIPIVSHEIGQYQIYPDYNEIKKYTGVLQARNLEVFRNRLERAGMLDQDIAFQKASGAWAALCYKAEMEAALRTQGFGGFQLLDLQDFPGQGTALVGILDAFMDSKNVVSREDWIKSCNDVVLLVEFPKYTWTNKETFAGKVNVANYSNHQINAPVQWEIKDQRGTVLGKGSLSNSALENGGLRFAGTIEFPLSGITTSEKLTLNVSIGQSSYVNSYPLWVYPETEKVSVSADILVANKLDKTTTSKLEKGAKVLLFPPADDVKGKTIKGLFPPDFWNYGMFKSISESNKMPVSPGTLGILTNPQHPIFNSFPTDSHTNWQWFSIIKASNPLILDNTLKSYRPIVQVIDNLERNHKLGLVFEYKVGKGKVLVCMSQLDKIQDQPEARQLYQSIVNYMNTKDFNPVDMISKEELGKLLY